MSMTTTTMRWPRGTGQWNRTRVLIVSAASARRDELIAAWAEEHDVAVVRCPLEVIRRCETDGPAISTVVIADLVGSVHPAELAAFLEETYPYLRVLVDRTPHTTLDDTNTDELLEAQA